MRTGRQLFSLLALLLLGACSPAMDWREYRVADGGFVVLFPQKPSQSERRLATPAGEVTMRMYSVRVGEHVLAAGYADFPVPVSPALMDAMRDALAANVGGAAVRERALEVRGMSAREFEASGTLGSGQGARQGTLRARLYARDGRYIQLVSAGSAGAIDAADVDMFMASLKPD